MTQLIDIGHNVQVAIQKYPDYIEEGRVAGLRLIHCKPGTQELCCQTGAYIPLGLEGQPGDRAMLEWDLISLDPLTISPSCLCRLCGDHGFIQNGKWVPA